MVLELADPLYVSSKKGLFIELSSKTLSLGDRVKRGPNWVFGEQDSRRPGTVVGENELSELYIFYFNFRIFIVSPKGFCIAFSKI